MLPKQVLPIYELVLPSTGKKINYRQMVVREEKILLQAQETDDIKVIINCVKEIIKNCTTGVKSVYELTTFDVELIITRIRSKSVGEKIDLIMPCDDDPLHERANVVVNLDTIEVNKPSNHVKKIHLFDDVGVIMRYPSLDDFYIEKISKLDYIKLCIESIYDKNNVFKSKDIDAKEMDEFVESLTEEQVLKIYNLFFDSMPRFEHTIEYKCPSCGKQHTKTLRGLSSFFV